MFLRIVTVDLFVNMNARLFKRLLSGQIPVCFNSHLMLHINRSTEDIKKLPCTKTMYYDKYRLGMRAE